MLVRRSELAVIANMTKVVSVMPINLKYNINSITSETLPGRYDFFTVRFQPHLIQIESMSLLKILLVSVRVPEAEYCHEVQPRLRHRHRIWEVS